MVFWFGFGRRDSFITHRAFCDALAEESAKTGAKPQAEDGKAAAIQDAAAAAAAAGQDATAATAETAPAAVMAAALPPQQVTPLERQGGWFSSFVLLCPSFRVLIWTAEEGCYGKRK